jgi:polyisoprenoid-binding protein YceI
MKRTLSISFVLALAAFAASADKFLGTNGSMVRVEGTSTLHAWKMESASIAGQISAATPDNWNAPAKAVVTIPVTSIKSEHAKMDKLMAEALKRKLILKSNSK